MESKPKTTFKIIMQLKEIIRGQTVFLNFIVWFSRVIS